MNMKNRLWVRRWRRDDAFTEMKHLTVLLEFFIKKREESFDIKAVFLYWRISVDSYTTFGIYVDSYTLYKQY